MQTIQIVLEKELLHATDRAARKRRVNRSALVREALRAHLKRLATAERERRDRDGHLARPLDDDDLGVWDEAAAWPDK